MIRVGLHARGLKNARRCRGGLAGGRVHERAASAHQTRQPLVLVLLVVNALDAKVDVRPIESGDEHLRLLETQQRDDVVAHFGRRRRGERGHRWSSTCAAARLAPRRRRTQASIVGAKVVTPLGDAMRLVDHEAGNLQLAEQPQELIRCEPFGRDIQQP